MAVRLREVHRDGIEEHFGPTDARRDLARIPIVGRLLRSRAFQFGFILPNQIIFWLVMATGLLGAALPTRNFATVITWYIWFCVVFLLMVGVGRGWCLMCPFGGFAEWSQRRSFWSRKKFSLSLGLRWPERWSRWGLLWSVGMFIALTWAEEYFNIAGPGAPVFTSYLVIFIIGLALVTFLIFERRTFCRYLCPLSALIGTVGSSGMVAGFRTRDRDVCLKCPTKDCMRGSERGYGCPWYEWPGSATSNLACGLCTECFKNCPYENVGLFVQPPLTSVIAPVNRRLDVAWAVALLFGLVVFQQVNALPFYPQLDGWLNRVTHFPGYPNPLDYLGIIGIVALAVAAWPWLVRAAARARSSSPSAWFKPIMYGFAPLMASDYLARQLPRFWDHALRIVPAISDPFGLGWNLFGTAHSNLYNVHLLSPAGVVHSQLIVVGLGALASLYATQRILRRDLYPVAGRPAVATVMSSALILVAGAAVLLLYVAMNGAQ